MSDSITERLTATPVVPLVQATDTDVAVRTTNALMAGGLTVIEVVMRTEEALECMAAITKAAPDAITGAGTVLSADQAKRAVEAGAQFIVSPGLDDGVGAVAKQHDLPVFPGIATATELQRAWNMGLRTVKFFPAGQAGGPPMLKSFSSVFRDVAFMPTGGGSSSNLTEDLAVPAVIAGGGSWLTPANEIAAGNYDAVTALAKDAADIAHKARS